MIQRRQGRPTHAVIEAQGHFVRLTCKGADQIGGGKRKNVTIFSPASRKRLLETLARIEPQNSEYQASFIALTYPAEFPDAATAKRHLFAFWKRVRRAFPQASAIWRLEFQKRGAPHFHLIYFGPFFGKHLVQQWWGEVIGQERPFTRIEALQSWRHALAYAAKYMAKVQEVPLECADAGGTAAGGDGAARDSGFNYVTYLTGKSGLGRVWGVLDRKKLPLGEHFEFPLEVLKGKWLHRWKRAARHKWQGVNRKRWLGASLFVENPEQWLHLAVVQKAEEDWWLEAHGPQEEKVIKRTKSHSMQRVGRMIRERQKLCSPGRDDASNQTIPE